MAAKFSFIIPTRNEAGYIEGCLRSIRGQRRRDYEIIVVDTLSIDRTQAIAKRYADKVLPEPRRGPAVARNTGARAARGSIFIFADADVRFDADFLDRIDKEFSRRRTLAGGICRLVPYDAPSALIARSYQVVDWLAWLLNALGIPITAGSCFIFRRSAFRRAGGFNRCLWTNEDHDMASRAARFGRFVHLDIPIYTSARRVAERGWLRMLLTYIKSTAMYALNKSCLRNYWDSEA
ncbi:MAG: glycosyltransferase [Candidatus Aenigmatarchaeota archaeon]